MLGLLAVVGIGCLSLAGALTYLGSAFVAQWAGIQDRRLDLDERALVIQEQKAKPSRSPIVPPDLMRRITRWGDPDAQDAERKAILDVFAEHQDAPDPWMAVRSHLPAEPRDDVASDHMFIQ